MSDAKLPVDPSFDAEFPLCAATEILWMDEVWIWLVYLKKYGKNIMESIKLLKPSIQWLSFFHIVCLHVQLAIMVFFKPYLKGGHGKIKGFIS